MVKISDPYAELAVNNAKYVKACTELYLAKKGIEELGDFDRFVNLEVLWLNDNRLERIDDLESNVRVQQLYVQNNNLKTLKGSLLKFKFLNTFNASNNQLHGLHATLDILSRLRRITHLDLFGNPLAEEADYRLHVIKRIPALLVFDRHVVTDEEKEAAKLLGTSRHQAESKEGSKPWVPDLSGTTKMMMSEVKKLRKQNADAEAAERKAMFQLEDDGDQKQLGDPPPAYSAKRQPTDSELDEWDKYNLKLLFEEYDKDSNNYLSQDELRTLLVEMEDNGRTVETGRIVNGKDSLDRMFESLDVNQDNKITWKEFLKGSTEGFKHPDAGDDEPMQPPLEWGKIDWEHARERSLELYDEAQTIQMKALELDKEDPRLQEMQEKAKRLSNKANRLDAIYAELTALIKAAPKEPPMPRSDLITICDYKQASHNGPEESDSSDEDEDIDDDDRRGKRDKFGLTTGDYSKYRKNRRAARPQKSIKNKLNI